MNFWKDPRWTKSLGFILDECFPMVIRDSRWFFTPIIRLWNKGMDPDFKEKAINMSENEIIQAYERLAPARKSDMTPRTKDFVLRHLTGRTILEVGCGNGDIAQACATDEVHVTATDLMPSLINSLREKIHSDCIEFQEANVENLPFPDKHFDTCLCLHTLEHVVNIQRAVAELKRVTSQRLIIIVPKQRYFRYTADYHLHFFASQAQLSMTLQIPNPHLEEIDFCLCYVGDLSHDVPA